MKWILITACCAVQTIFASQIPTFQETLHHYLHSTQWLKVQDTYKQRVAEIDQSFLKLFPTYYFSGMFGSEYRQSGEETATRLKTKNVTLNMSESFQFGKDYYRWQARERDRFNENLKRFDERSNVLMAGSLLHLKGFLIHEKMKILDRFKIFTMIFI